jgi:hypothetical protein
VEMKLQLLLLPLALAAACGRNGSPDADLDGGPRDSSCSGVDVQNRRFVDLNVRGESFSSHDGRTVYLVTRTSPTVVLGAASATVVAGGFAVHLEGGYDRSSSQQLLWFVDQDGDGKCALASGDHMGYLALDPVDPVANDSLDLVISDNHVSDVPGSPDPCSGASPFADMSDMSVTASGFEAHEGAAVQLLTRSLQTGAVFGRGQATVAAGGFGFRFPRAFVSFTYQEVFWYVDLDGDGACTAADHPGYAVTSAARPTGNEPFDLSITDNHTGTSVGGADVCTVMNDCR